MSGLKKTQSRPNVSPGKEKTTILYSVDVSVINHDLKTHLSPIKMCAEMLESHFPGPLNEKQERMIGTIHRCVDKLESLVKDITDVYKLELHSMSFEKTELDVPIFLDRCATILRPFIMEKQIELKIELGEHGPIYADANRLEQVLVNLVKNSADFVPETGGKITITVEKDQALNMLFCIEDNGEGVKSEDLEKIFDKFYKGGSKQSRKYGGSGLGLTICKGILEAHDGQIWLDPRHKNGSLVKFTIPLMPS